MRKTLNGQCANGLFKQIQYKHGNVYLTTKPIYACYIWLFEQLNAVKADDKCIFMIRDQLVKSK